MLGRESPKTGCGYEIMTSIMLVDDNEGFLAVAQEYIEAFNDFQVIQTANSGEDALTLLEHERPDILVVDLSMHGMSGLDVARSVKGRWPGLPVVILTMLDTDMHRQAAHEAGADAYVVKTTMDTDLIPHLERLCQANPSRCGNAKVN